MNLLSSLADPVSPNPKQFVEGEQIRGMTERPIGVTADDVNTKQPLPQTQFEFLARGGIANTVKDAVDKRAKQMRFNIQKREFENLLAKQYSGAEENWNKITEEKPELVNWIPHPKIFNDPESGRFMGLKYYESYWKGAQNFAEADAAAKKQKLESDKLENKETTDELNRQLTERRVVASEKNAATAAKNSETLAKGQQTKDAAETRQLQKNLAEQAEKKTKQTNDEIKFAYEALQDATRQRSDYTKQIQAAQWGNDEEKKNIEKGLRKAEQDIRNNQKTYTRMVQEKTGHKVSPEAVVAATDLDNWMNDEENGIPANIAEFLKKSPIDQGTIDEDTQGYSPEVKKIYAFAVYNRTDVTPLQIKLLLEAGADMPLITEAIIERKGQVRRVVPNRPITGTATRGPLPGLGGGALPGLGGGALTGIGTQPAPAPAPQQPIAPPTGISTEAPADTGILSGSGTPE